MPPLNRPCLRPDLMLTSADGASSLEIWLRGLRVGFFSADDPGQALFQVLIELLDGCHTTDYITATCLARGHSAEDVDQMLEELDKRGIIFDAGEDEVNDSLLAQYRWWGCFTHHPAAVQKRLAEANLIIINDSWVGRGAAQALQVSGLQPQVIACSASDPGHWQATCRAADFLLVILTGAPAEEILLTEINSLLVEQRIPALLLAVNGSAIHLGPLVVPGQTVCLASGCGRKRPDSIPANQRFQAHLRPAAPTPFILSATHLAAAAAMDFLAQTQTSPWLNRVWHMDWRTGMSHQYSLLKNPRCSVCSRLQYLPEGRSIDA